MKTTSQAAVLPLASQKVKSRIILLTTYFKGSPEGRHLGTPGYSYEFVARLFQPLLERWGQVIEVRRPEKDLDAEVRRAQIRGLQPIHVCFRAFQDADLTDLAPNVVCPAWEYPEVPDHAFDGEPRNNWVLMANRCAMVLVGNPFTAHALARAGAKTRIAVVQVPNPRAYYDVASWHPDIKHVLDFSAHAFGPRFSPESDEAAITPENGPALRARLRRWAKATAKRSYKSWLRPCLPARLDEALCAGGHAASLAWRFHQPIEKASRPLELSGIVYTTILNPSDGRKNWEDLITGFLFALGERDDATLVVKLITTNRAAANLIMTHYRKLDLAHKCRIVFIRDFLSDAQMLDLVRASAYYVATSRAEGNCLPLMNYLAAGRPGVSTRNSAVADYFDAGLGFVIESHPEPTSWPQDLRHRCRATWHRLVWPSLVEQLRQSYHVAKECRQTYEQLACNAVQVMRDWASYDNVWPRLKAALDQAATPVGAQGRISA